MEKKRGHQTWFQRRRDRRQRAKVDKRLDERPFGWSVQVSDWPVGKTRDDLSAGAAIRALKGLGDIYDEAMESLASATDPDIDDNVDEDSLASSDVVTGA